MRGWHILYNTQYLISPWNDVYRNWYCSRENSGGTGKQSWHPVAQLNPRCGRLRHGAVLASHMPWYHHFTHIASYKKLRGLRQKPDALHVQNRQSLSKYLGLIQNSCVTNEFQFFELTWTLEFLCVRNAPFEATSSIFKPIWLHLLFFMHLLLFF